jgi:hypothetical protein
VATDPHSSNGDNDIFVTRFDSSGAFAWARTWGGSDDDFGSGSAVDSSGNECVTGYFQGNSVDFNPDPVATDPHSSNGGYDIFISRFKPDGLW